MPFLLLLFLTLVCLQEKWPKPWWAQGPSDRTAAVSAAVTWLGVALVVAFARAIAAGAAGRLAAYPGRRERVLRRYGRLRTYHVFLLLGGYALVLYVLGWGWTVQQWCGSGRQEMPGAELLLLAPFLTGLVLSWVAFYDAERALHRAAEPAESEPFWSRGAYVLFHVRQNLALVFAPLLLLLLLKGARHLFPAADEESAALATTAGGLVLSLCVVVGMPWLLRLVLGLKPMAAGPLRTRLETAARRLNFRCSNILVWNTHGSVVNAMVAGVVPWVRYVLLTDRLMTELTPDEVEAVFGHEVGHAKHYHMLYYLGFLLTSLFLVGFLWTRLAVLLGLPEQPDHNDSTWQALPLVMMLGAYIFVVFGFLSRRCERQADVYGCRAVSCPRPDCCGHEEGVELAAGGRGLCPTGIRTFIDALEKVARLNGISRDKPGWLSSWQHSTIARRVGFLQDVLADPPLERRFQRRVALVKWGLFLGLLAALSLLALTAPPEKARATEPAPVTPGTAGHTALSE